MKNNNIEHKRAVLSPVQIPPENKTGRSMITPSCFALVIILFFFSFCNFTVATEGARFNIDVISLSGFNLATASESSPVHNIGSDNIFASAAFNGNNAQSHIMQKSPFNIWALLSLAVAVGGMMLFFKKERWEVLTGIAIIGLVSLIILQFDLKNKYEEYIDGGLFPVHTRVSFQLGYWIAVIAFTLAGVSSYLHRRQKRRKETRQEKIMPTPLHVNIITQQANSKEN